MEHHQDDLQSMVGAWLVVHHAQPYSEAFQDKDHSHLENHDVVGGVLANRALAAPSSDGNSPCECRARSEVYDVENRAGVVVEGE